MSERQPIVEHDGQPHYEDINTPLIFMLTAIAAIVTYAMVAAISGLYFQLKNARQAAINAETVTMASDMIRGEKEKLAAGDAANSIKPIDDAMKDVVSGLGGTWEVPQPAADDGDHDHEHADHDHDEATEAKSGDTDHATEAAHQEAAGQAESEHQENGGE